MRIVCLVVLHITGLYATVMAQQQSDVDITVNRQAKSDSIRDQYILRYPDHFFLWPVLKRRSLNFEIQKESDQGNKLTYRPNKAYSLGLGMYLFDLGLEVTFALPINERSKERYGNSSARDLQINALSKKWGADLYHQRYDGFYISDSKIDLDRNDIHPQRRDIDTRNFGLAGIYIFNDKKFSFRTAYTFAERQLKSGGSFLMTGTINSFKLEADSAVIDSSNQIAFGAGSSFQQLKYTTFSISPGYGYNFIFGDFFFNGTLLLGPAHNWIYYQEEDGSGKNDITINVYAAFRVGIGYNSDRFFAGINYVGQSRSVKFEDIQFTNSIGTFRLLVGYRFREFGFLQKSVWDIPKAMLN